LTDLFAMSFSVASKDFVRIDERAENPREIVTGFDASGGGVTPVVGGGLDGIVVVVVGGAL
jgi:hypothetical protein